MEVGILVRFRGLKKSFLNSVLLCLAWLAFSLVGAKAQTTKTDTLFYFHPDSLIESCYCPPIVLKQKDYASCYAEDYAIYYEVNESIKYYYLKELHIQFVSDFENCYSHGPLPEGFEIYVRIGRLDCLPEQGIQLDSLPGEIVATIPVIINNVTELYPNWKIINLDNIPNLRNLYGNFWIQGGPICTSTWDTSFSSTGYTFANEYYDYGWKWITGPELPNWAVKAVIEYSSLGIADDPDNIPEMYQLYQNYPNPFNTQTIITYSAPSQAAVSITIYDVLGREIRNLRGSADERGLGNYVIWDGKNNSAEDVPSGVYLYRLNVFSQVDGPTKTKKLLLLR